MDENRSRPNSRNSEPSIAVRRKEGRRENVVVDCAGWVS